MKPTTDVKWVELNARVEPEQLKPGDTGRLVLEALIPPGGHIEAHEPPDPYLIPTVLELSTEDGMIAGPVLYPEAEERRLDWSPMELRVLTGSVRFEAPLKVASRASAGARTITARLRYQACTNGACLPPNVQTVVLKAHVGS